MKLKEASAIAGTIGSAGKLSDDGRQIAGSYGLPSAEASFVPKICQEKGWAIPPKYGCSIGSILKYVSGSTCELCYADERGNYTYTSVQVAQTKRLVGLSHPLWVEAVTLLLSKNFDKRFASSLEEELDFFFCNKGRMPNKKEWLFLHKKVEDDVSYFRWHDSGDIIALWHLYKIYKVAKRTPYLKHWLPTRETKIITSSKKEEKPFNLTIRHSAHMVNGPLPKRVSNVSGVTTSADYTCYAPDNYNECGSCRDCWNKDIDIIIYLKH